jgi:hypothetical protein
MLHADDSAGTIGDLAYELLDAHARACDAGVADPMRLARWMIRFRFKDQDFLIPTPFATPPHSRSGAWPPTAGQGSRSSNRGVSRAWM